MRLLVQPMTWIRKCTFRLIIYVSLQAKTRCVMWLCRDLWVLLLVWDDTTTTPRAKVCINILSWQMLHLLCVVLTAKAKCVLGLLCTFSVCWWQSTNHVGTLGHKRIGTHGGRSVQKTSNTVEIGYQTLVLVFRMLLVYCTSIPLWPTVLLLLFFHGGVVWLDLWLHLTSVLFSLQVWWWQRMTLKRASLGYTQALTLTPSHPATWRPTWETRPNSLARCDSWGTSR